MKKIARIFALLLTLCLLSGVMAMFAFAADAPKNPPYDDLGYANDHERATPGSTPSYSINGTRSTGVCSTTVVSAHGNKYMRYEYVADYSNSKNPNYRRDLILGNHNKNGTASTAGPKLEAGTLKGLKSYSYFSVDFDICADQYRYLIDIETTDENGNPIIKTEEKLSATYPTEEGAYGIRLAYSDKSYFSLDMRPVFRYEVTTTNEETSETTTEYKYYSSGQTSPTNYTIPSSYTSLQVYLRYDSANNVWKIYNSSSSTSSSSYLGTLSNDLGEWNHFTYVVEVNHDKIGNSVDKLYFNGELVNSSTIWTGKASWLTVMYDVLPRSIDWQINNINSIDSNNNCKYSMGIDNWTPRYYDADYSSGDAYGIDDLFASNSTVSLIDCKDVVYNADYVYPAPNKYVEIGDKKVYVPVAVGAAIENIENGAVITTPFDIPNITPPAWSNITIKCDQDTSVTLSNKAIARGATITKTSDGYKIGAGIMANMSLFTDMRFNLYLPKIDGASILSVSGASLAEETYWINGSEMLVVYATPGIADFDAIEAKIRYSIDGKENEISILLDTLSYASSVAKSYECGSDEAKLAYEIIRYKEAAAKYLDPEFTDESGKLSAFKAIYSAHTDCKCEAEEISISDEEINVDYSALIEKGVTGIAYQITLDDIGILINVNAGTKITSVRYENASGNTVTHTEENGNLINKGGYYLVKEVSAASIRSIMTITADGAEGTFSLGRYIHNNPTVDIAKRIYTYSQAAEAYKTTMIPYKASHLILNADGSYGGSFDEELYGEGAPLNGKYDVDDSAYYTVNNDYYNLPSTSERVILPGFSSYQQTMQDSSGLACLLMILNYMGEDVSSEYSEISLLKKYQEINNSTVYGKGTTADGLEALVESLGLGYTAEHESLTITSSDSKSSKQSKMKSFFRDNLEDGKFVLVRYQSPTGYGWKLVIGYDTLGNIQDTLTEKFKDAFGDDVIIFAEPYDGYDHCQDGYATERAQDFLVWWRNMSIDGTVNETYSYLVIDTGLDIEFDYQPVDETVKQELYDIHLPLNPDGTYGGTRNEKLYGDITSGRGWWNHTESNYYKINDFYNMGSEGSRILLSNYTVLQQTMSSSCGLCSVTSILKYYGLEGSYYDLELEYLNHYESVNSDSDPVKGHGSSTLGNVKALTEWGYTTEYGYADKGTTPKYSTYEAYIDMIRTHLLAGRPISVTTNLGSGHFLTIIGYDDMGTDYIYDDVIITADSCDYWDGYQDGYTLYSAYKFFTQHTNGAYGKLQQHIVIFRNDQ